MSTCTYTGHHFGAHYEDAECHDGYLWDLDSYEDGMLTSGGDIPCPHCNLDQWLTNVAENCVNDALNSRVPNEEPFENLTRTLLSPLMQRLHGFGAMHRAGRLGLLDVEWYGGQGLTLRDDPVARIAWPWPIPADVLDPLTMHERLTLMAGLSDLPIPPGFAPRDDGLVLGPLRPDDL